MQCEELIKLFAKKDSGFKALLQKMPKVKEAVKVLKIPYVVTKMLQKYDAKLSDFYGACIMMKEKLKVLTTKHEKQTNLAENLGEFERRRSKMLDNSAMLAAVYLDRRFSADLNESQIGLAKLYLMNLWERIRKSRRKIIEIPEANEVQPNQLSDSVDEEEFSFQKYFQAKGLFVNEGTHTSVALVNLSEPPITNNNESVTPNGTDNFGPNYLKTKPEFAISLDEFERKFPIIRHDTSIIPFWEERKNHFQEINEIAVILFGIPPSQAEVERSFSQFGFVFTCRRTNLGPNLLQDIMMIKLNKELAYKVFENDLKIEKTKFENSKQF